MFDFLPREVLLTSAAMRCIVPLPGALLSALFLFIELLEARREDTKLEIRSFKVPFTFLFFTTS